MSILARYLEGQTAGKIARGEIQNPMLAMGGMGGGSPVMAAVSPMAAGPFAMSVSGGGYGGGAADSGMAGGSEDPTLSLIKQFEGFRETPYWDVNALRTGYGSDTVTMADGSIVPVSEGTRVTREDADRDLQRRVQTEFMPIAAKAVGEDIFSSLQPNQKAALTSIAYNYGKLPSSVAEAVRSGDPAAVARAISALGSHNDGINRGRREKEAAFYLGRNPMMAMAGM